MCFRPLSLALCVLSPVLLICSFPFPLCSRSRRGRAHHGVHCPRRGRCWRAHLPLWGLQRGGAGAHGGSLRALRPLPHLQQSGSLQQVQCQLHLVPRQLPLCGCCREVRRGRVWASGKDESGRTLPLVRKQDGVASSWGGTRQKQREELGAGAAWKELIGGRRGTSSHRS